MNIVVVNQVCPSVPHVGGTRAWRFANALASRGHRVVQVSEGSEHHDGSVNVEHLATRWETHDWSGPLLIRIARASHAVPTSVTSIRLPALARKSLVMWSYLARSGVRTHFSGSARPYLPRVASGFRPNLVWGLFGNTDCWLVAQRLARLARCPWVADMKDSWDSFVPRLIRGTIARRFPDMAACTCNSEFTSESCRRWFRCTPSVVYSGVDPCFVGHQSAAPDAPAEAVPRLVITGSLYERRLVEEFASSVRRWSQSWQRASTASSRRPVVEYAGCNPDLAEQALRPLADCCDVRIHGYLPLPDLAALCRSATVNAYIRSSRTFHHKLLELLACGRPIIAFPGETGESRRLAEQCRGRLECPGDAAGLDATLHALMGTSCSGKALCADVSRFSWESQAETLERLFLRLCGGLVA